MVAFAGIGTACSNSGSGSASDAGSGSDTESTSEASSDSFTISSGKAADLVARTDSVFQCQGETYTPSGGESGDALFCDAPGESDTQLHFNVWSPKYSSAQGVSEITQQCRSISSSTQLTSSSNYAFIGKNWIVTMGGTISADRAEAMRTLTPVVVYDCGG